MNPWTILLIGILLGWLIEYVIDWFFWRRRPTDEKIVADLQEQLQTSEKRASDLEAQLAEAKADSETWQAQNDELESEMAAAAEKEETPKYEKEEFQGSLKGKLAALGIGAAAGATIATSGDDEDGTEEGLDDVDAIVLTEAASGEPFWDESVATEDISSDEAALDPENEPLDAESVVEAESIESDPLAEAEESEEGQEESSVAESDEIFVSDADLNGDVEIVEEIDSIDPVYESERPEPGIDDDGETNVFRESDSGSEDSSPEEGTDSPDENAFTSSGGGQES